MGMTVREGILIVEGAFVFGRRRMCFGTARAGRGLILAALARRSRRMWDDFGRLGPRVVASLQMELV